jgi:hypothetical protein
MVRHIEAALTRTFGRIEGPSARRALGINPHTLRAHAQARHRLAALPWESRSARRLTETSSSDLHRNGTPLRRLEPEPRCRSNFRPPTCP